MGKQPFAVDDVGAQLKETLDESDTGFEHALITTYTVTPGYLDWFDDLETLVCTPSDTADKIRLSEDVAHDELSLLERDVHGKCVIVWGPDRIVAWTGSFNLSYAGLFSNVEWASRFEGTVKTAFTLEDLLAGKIPSNATNNDRITQLLDTVQSLVRRTPAASVEDGLRRWPSEPIVVHSGRGESLRRSVTRCLRETSGDVTLSYFTPNVNKTGIRELTALAPPDVGDDQLSIDVYGADPAAVIDTTQPSLGSFLGTADVDELAGEFSEFNLHTRFPGDDGETLPSGSQIRGGLAHLKVLLVTETDGAETVLTDVLLTSANLTSNAWKKNGENVEYGIWLRNPDRIETVGNFFLESLAECYGRADAQTLTDIDERIEAGSGGFLPYTRQSIGELVSATLTASSTEIVLNWPDETVPFEIEHAHWYVRDIVTGEVTTQDATLSSDSRRVSAPAEIDGENQYIESVELQVTTPLETPVYQLSGSQLTQWANDELDEPIEEWDRLLIGETAYSTATTLPTDVLEAADDGYLYRSYDRSLSRSIRLEAGQLESAGFTDPFLPETVLTAVRPTTQMVDEVGQLPCLELTFAPGVTPPTDGLEFETETDVVQPVGWIDTPHGRQYAFEPQLAAESLTVSLDEPFEAHHPAEHHECTLPTGGGDTQIDTETTERRLQQVSEVCPQYTLAEISVPDVPGVESAVDPFIHEDSPLDIALPEDNVAVTAQTHAYEYSRAGYFYSPPQQQDCTEPLTPPAPYASLQIRGLLGVETDSGTLWLSTDTATADVRKRLVSAIEPSADIPASIPFASLDPEQAIMWLGFDFGDIVVEDAGDDVFEDLEFECWRNGDQLEQSRPIRALREPPEYVAVPLFRSLFEETATYRIVIRPAEAGTKYAWSANEYRVGLERQTENQVKLTIGGHATFGIRDDDQAPAPMINLDRLLRVRLGEELPYHPYLENTGERRPETIRQMSEVLLRFVEAG
ncbi:hypothetical protein [Haloarcula laminariae]|uniref:hypothetical protein n=1 Tax=Haloarcula laminariae TaxID=2961577 RepID=UPI0021C9228F|nr:hypothetical protein [Halomicroarcula laminariae]